jgi:mevalonate kinase
MISVSYFHGNGKILLSGEYLILHGAKALALPSLMGQSLSYTPCTESGLWEWETQVMGKTQLKLKLDQKLSPTDIQTIGLNPAFLLEAIRAAADLNPSFLHKNEPGSLLANLEFPANWGLGSSSTLIHNLSQLFEISAFDLHFAVSNGSGYDIACAASQSPIFYQVANQQPLFTEAPFQPDFKDQLYFLYLGKKQDSAAEVKKFLANKKVSSTDVDTISEISIAMTRVKLLSEFNELILEHEKLLSTYLGTKPIKQEYFHGFDGEIKSLGAWGGDFALISTKNSKKYLIDYFFAKNLNQIFSFERLIHNRIEGHTQP